MPESEIDLLGTVLGVGIPLLWFFCALIIATAVHWLWQQLFTRRPK